VGRKKKVPSLRFLNPDFSKEDHKENHNPLQMLLHDALPIILVLTILVEISIQKLQDKMEVIE
jgi:hypothetical protein